MLLQKERELVVEYGRKMSAGRLCTGTSGNISVYVPERGLMAISPSGIGYFDTRPEDVVVTDLEANIVDGTRKPSSEWALHTLFYKRKPHIRAVVHTHSMYCTTFAVLGRPLQAVHYAIADAGAAEIPCAPYHPFGTLELAEAAIYVTMYRLVEKGYVTDKREVAGEGKPRLRVYYHITDLGREYFKSILEAHERSMVGLRNFFSLSEEGAV